MTETSEALDLKIEKAREAGDSEAVARLLLQRERAQEREFKRSLRLRRAQ